MKRLFLFVAAIAFLSSCATDKHLKSLMNSANSIDYVSRHLGPPASVQPMPDSQHLYIWSTNRNLSMGGYPVYTPDNRTYSGTVSTPSGGYATYTGYSTGGSVSYTPVHNVNLQCTLRIVVREDGSIADWTYQGNDCDNLIVVMPAAVSLDASFADSIDNNPNVPDSDYWSEKIAYPNSPQVEECLKERAAYHTSNQNLSLESLIDIIMAECEQSTGRRLPSITKFQAQQALMKKTNTAKQ